MLVVYDDADPATRADASAIEPLLVGLAAGSPLRRFDNGRQDLLAVRRELGVPLNDMSPLGEVSTTRRPSGSVVSHTA